ncbi:hypothetical protein F4X33_02395 [Candidatus Poribacteria bacterium]|nr:hypothetical protein [Candidatus Poribacteria bacterium]
MTKSDFIYHEFVNRRPETMTDGVVYVSFQLKVVVHMCCCGCRNPVVTPLNPEAWKITFDGTSISLFPSIGNRNLPCRSHYVICRNRIVWLPGFTEPSLDPDRTYRGMLAPIREFVSNLIRRG